MEMTPKEVIGCQKWFKSGFNTILSYFEPLSELKKKLKK